MEIISKDIDELFAKLQEKYSIVEYIEISTCNRKEYFIHNKHIPEDEELLSHENKSIVIDYGQSAVMHLLRMTSGLESMIVGEDQILGQVKDTKHKAVKDRHCGKILDAIFTKAIHVGQVVRNKTNINKGSVSIGSAAIDLAEKYIGDLENKSVLVIGAGKMGKLVAKALAEKDLNAIFVANRTYYVAVDLAKDLGGEAILFNDLEKYLATADLVISATSAPHPIITKERLLKSPRDYESLMLIDIANPRDISEDVLPNEATGFKESKIWGMLYNFQRDAALAIINKLEKFNGCILADSVGLGKTFTALAIIKYYENRNKSVLVLCPKKLANNWNTYKDNYVNNPIAADRLRYNVLYHTDLSRNHGSSNGLDLDRLNWGNYDLVVIDESHNFRNGGKSGGDSEKENRYLRLLNKVIRTGVKTKVLMLSATPVNNRFNDLKNQLALAYEGNSNLINEKLNTKSTM